MTNNNHNLPQPKLSLPSPMLDWSLLNNPQVRKALVQEYGFRMFCLIYLHHYFYRPPASYHSEMMEKLSDYSLKRLLLIGHRESAKSTIGSVALPLFMALEHPELYPFIIPIADTSLQSGLNIANIKTELDSNEWLIQDYGHIPHATTTDPVPEPTLESEEEWQARNMLLANGVRIMARSRGQKIRGLRHRAARPSAVIIDDPEDTEWVKTRENRDKTDRWMRGEVMGAIAQDARIIVIGNWLHEDALMARLKSLSTFTTLEYPLIKEIDGESYVTWPALYPDEKSLKEKMEEMGTVAWMREMLLKVVAEEGQEVLPEDIHYYDELPDDDRVGLKGHGVDLAISTEESADYTTDVEGHVHYDEGRPKIYIQPNPLEARLTFYHTMEYFKSKPRGIHYWFVEEVAYQKAAIQEMERAGMAVQPIRPISDKRARLRVAARYIKNGTVLFPRKGAEKLVQQLLNFGNEAHDDLVDGLTNLILGAVAEGLEQRKVIILR